MPSPTIESLDLEIARLGIALEPTGDANDIEGVLNPASTRTRAGGLLLYPRAVARGNVSRIGLFEAVPPVPGAGVAAPAAFASLGFALEPTEASERRSVPGGYGCEDPRVTFVPVLDEYVMAYTAFGPDGPRIAIALSDDGYSWSRLGLVDFSAPGLPHGDDKDAAFFPEPVLSPDGVLSIAFYHRPMLHVSAVDGRGAVPIILAMPASARESTRIAYVPLDAVLADRRNLLKVRESVVVLEPGETWGRIKNGGGTPPVRIDEGWFSFFHGVDALYDADGLITGMRYSAGVVIHDLERPDRVLYRSPEPAFSPQTADELRGVVGNVVFPTAIDVRPGAAPRDFDVYYGMADSRIGIVRVRLGASRPAAAAASGGAAETAA
jgi:predicted GH43/DUF377 family glycosyl hydrolase